MSRPPAPEGFPPLDSLALVGGDEPSGAVVAAPTSSLPEHLGGHRNWDYRYAWLRDAGFALDVLYRLGARSEADRYALWLCRTIREPGPPLRSLYGIDHGADLRERTLDELEGYHGSRPVRVGNAASEHLQLDAYDFLDGSDPLMARTIDAVLAELAPPGSRWHGLLWRYRSTAGDGLMGEEGAFAAASFWLVEALVLAGRRREAEAMFRDLVTLGGPLGLFGEEIDPASGAALGNYPQAFTHIGLVDAALCLDRAGQPPPRGVGCHLRAP